MTLMHKAYGVVALCCNRKSEPWLNETLTDDKDEVTCQDCLWILDNQRPELIQLGDFTLNSGAKSSYKLECDHFSDEAWKGFAELIRIMVPLFSEVVGVPRGGLKLAEYLKPYANPSSPLTLIVDDVLTTGGSMERLRKTHLKANGVGTYIGAVVFARGPLPSWIGAIFPMPEVFWLQQPEKQSYSSLAERLTYCPALYSHWKHYKNGYKYLVVGRGILEKTQEPVVHYLDVADLQAVPMVRPLVEWNEVVSYEGKSVFRFTQVRN